MFQRRSPLRPAPRTRTLAVGGALAALAVVGGGTVVAVSAPSAVEPSEIRLVQNTAAQEMALGVPVDLDLEPVVARAAGGTVPEGTTVQVTGLPDGLVQNGWVISGTPTRAGTYDVLVTVSNSGVSESEKVSITVTDDADADADTATAETTTATGGEAEADGAGNGVDDEATTSPSTDATTQQPEPTLSAVPGDEAAQNGRTDAGGDTGTGTSPDLCAIVGEGEGEGEGDATDGSSLANGLAPLLTGDGESAPAGLTMVLVNAIAGILPSLLGENGSAADVGSFGEILCTLEPGLISGGSDGAAGAGGTTGAGGGADTGTGDTTGADGEATTADGAAGMATLLSGLMGAGTGSLGG